MQIDADHKKNTKWALHEAVWYSFMADSVINKNYYPELHQSGFEFNVDSFEEFQKLLAEYKEGLELHVHHETRDTCHNVLADLAALPKVLHTTLHSIANTKGESEQFFKTVLFSKFIVDNTPELKATFIFPDKENGVRQIDIDYDEAVQKAARNDKIVGSIATQIIKDISYDYLKTHRLVKVSGIKDINFHSVRVFEIFIIGDKEKDIEIGFHSYKPDDSLDYDILVDFETKTIEYVKENKTISFAGE